MRGVARSALWKPSFLLTQVGVIGVLLSLRTSVGYSQVLVIPTLPGLEKVGAQALKPQWAPVDSVALELMKRPGMDVVRYQADRLEYRANDGLMMLVGKKGSEPPWIGKPYRSSPTPSSFEVASTACSPAVTRLACATQPAETWSPSVSWRTTWRAGRERQRRVEHYDEWQLVRRGPPRGLFRC